MTDRTSVRCTVRSTYVHRTHSMLSYSLYLCFSFHIQLLLAFTLIAKYIFQIIYDLFSFFAIFVVVGIHLVSGTRKISLFKQANGGESAVMLFVI